MRWQDKISKKQLKHLRQHGITVLREVKETVEHQNRLRKQHPDVEPCHDCKIIAYDLGLEVQHGK